jgi:signal transduction histidine kinase
MVFYVAIGLMTGILIERQWRARERTAALERELARSERLSSLGQMAAGLAHEIKNPLGSIQGAAEILGDDAPPGSKQRDLLDVLRKESRRLGGVVDGFLGFARPRPLELAPLDVARALERVSKQIALDASARHIEIGRDVAPDLPAITADAEQLHQVFLNLLLNAIAASRDGGRISVAARSTMRNGRRAVAIAVEDHGSGIPADVLPRVFDPFFTTKPPGEGSGLGLSVSYGIVTEHGGRLRGENRPEGGAVFTIELPWGDARR